VVVSALSRCILCVCTRVCTCVCARVLVSTNMHVHTYKGRLRTPNDVATLLAVQV
jgi:hypothetical protein